MVGAEDSGACFKISSSGTWVHIKYTILSLATFYLSNMLNLLMDLKAKLGEQNKFYYDEKLKRWVEEGAEVPAEEPPLPPPPTKMSFQNSVPDSNLNGAPPLVEVMLLMGLWKLKTQVLWNLVPGCLRCHPPRTNSQHVEGWVLDQGDLLSYFF